MKKELTIIIVGILLAIALSFISAYTSPAISSINITMCSYTPPSIDSINITLDTADDCGEADIDYSVVLPLGFLRFLNCSPDYENPSSIPQGQSSANNSINATNNGTGTANLQIRINANAATGWELYASNQSDLSQNLTLSTSWQTIYGGVDDGLYRKIWLFANCSFISSNPRTSIEMKVV